MRPCLFERHCASLLEANGVIFKIDAINISFSNPRGKVPTAMKVVVVAFERGKHPSGMFVNDLVLGIVDGVGVLSAIFIHQRPHQHAQQHENGQLYDLVLYGILQRPDFLLPREVLARCVDHSCLILLFNLEL